MRSASLALAAIAAPLLLAPTSAFAEVTVTVNKSIQQMTVEVDGVPRWTWPVSTGRLDHDTPAGSFAAIRMEADHFSKEWDNAPMPFSIFFTENGHAIHGSLSTGRLGSPASHGCVRLAPKNAEKLYTLVREQGLANTRIVLTGDVHVALAGHGMPRAGGAERLADRADRKSEPKARPDASTATAGHPVEYAMYQTFGSYKPDYSNQFR